MTMDCEREKGEKIKIKTAIKGIASEIKDLHLKSNNLTSLKYSPKTLNSLEA